MEGVRWLDKEKVTSFQPTDQLCFVRPGAPVGQKEKRIETSDISSDDFAEGDNNLYFTDQRALDATEKTNNSVGWEMTGGVDTKTLVVSDDCEINQDVKTDSSLLLGRLGVSLDPLTSWIAGYFGDNAGGDRVVFGTLNGYVTFGAHNAALNAWADPIFNPSASVTGAKFGVGLNISGGQTPNATFHAAGSTIIGSINSPLADEFIYPGQIHPWTDEVNDQVILRVRKSGGSYFNINLQSGATLDSKWETYVGNRLRPKTTLGIDTIEVFDSGGAQSFRMQATTTDVLLYASAGDFKFNRAIYFEEISTPATPASGNKLYSKTDGFLHALDASGNEIPITGKGERVITFSSTSDEKKNRISDRILYVDSTGGAVIIEVDHTIIKNSDGLTIVNHNDGGVNTVQFQAKAGQYIMGLTTAFSLNNEGTNATIKGGPPTSPYGIISGSGAA